MVWLRQSHRTEAPTHGRATPPLPWLRPFGRSARCTSEIPRRAFGVLRRATNQNPENGETVNIGKFLETYVEGYLFHDLRNIERLPVRKGEQYGAALYPMVSATLTGMELVGFLISHGAFNTKKAEQYFSHYWDNVLAQRFPEYSRCSGLAHVIRALARDGLAHSFLTKGRMEVVKGDSPGHLDFDTQSLYVRINCSRLWEHFRDSYLGFVKPIVIGQALQTGTPPVTQATMEVQLQRLLSAYSRHAVSAFSQMPTGFARTFEGSMLGSSAPTANTVIVTTGSRGPTF